MMGDPRKRWDRDHPQSADPQCSNPSQLSRSSCSSEPPWSLYRLWLPRLKRVRPRHSSRGTACRSERLCRAARSKSGLTLRRPVCVRPPATRKFRKLGSSPPAAEAHHLPFRSVANWISHDPFHARKQRSDQPRPPSGNPQGNR